VYLLQILLPYKKKLNKLKMTIVEY